MLHDGDQALVVDPGEAVSVKQALAALGVRLTAILVTHRHADHTGGVAELHALGGVQVWGPDIPGLPDQAQRLHGGERLCWQGLSVQVMATPGHTRDHLAFVLPEGLHAGDDPLAFVGDTLFSAGCGRVFEGPPEALYDSLQRLCGLPDATRVCPAHEYTVANLRFAHAVEPSNEAVLEHLRRCEALRADGQATLPSTLRLERRINPFLRCTETEVVNRALEAGAISPRPESVFAALRQWKNEFR